MSEREFTAYVVLNNPEGTGAITFEPGDVVPEWASVGEHVTQGVTQARQTSEEAPASDDTSDESEDAADDDELPPYAEWSKTDLRAEVDGRELDVPAKAVVADLVAALEADDAAVAAEEAE